MLNVALDENSIRVIGRVDGECYKTWMFNSQQIQKPI